MPERVLLMGVDGLDWTRLRDGVAAGRLPHFAQLLAEGAYAELGVREVVPGLSGPEGGFVSPVLWTTIASGQYYFQHGVYDFYNAAENPERPPLFESRHCRSPRIWDVLSNAGLASLVLGYYVTHPAYQINGLMVSDLFGEVQAPDAVWPLDRGDELAQLAGHADYQSMVGHSGGLSNPDGARRCEPLRPGSPERELQTELLRRFTEISAAELDALFDDPQRGRERQLLNYRLVYPFLRDSRFHTLALRLLPKESWRFATIYYRLLDFVGHGFWVAGHELPAHTQRRFGDTVMRAYAWVDQCLGELLATLEPGDRLLVVSDHGFGASPAIPDFSADKDVSEFTYGVHAEPAVLIAHGGPTRGAIKDVGLLDVAPSILDFFGLPQADTLDGGPVAGLLTNTPAQLPRVPAYDLRGSTAAARMTMQEEELVRERLAALGYV